MSTVVGRLHAVLGLDATAFQQGLNGATRDLTRIGRDMQRLGRDLSVRVTAPIAGFGFLSLRTAADFESAMNKVAAVSGSVGEGFQRLEDMARELGRTTVFSASQAADAMTFLAMAGYDTEQILGAMPDTLKLAAAAGLDMASAADTVTNILAGYQMEVGGLSHAVDVLVKAFTSANTDLSQLGEAMKYAGPVASAAGIEFEEAAAALAMMGNAGIQGSMAGTSLRGAIARILSPTKSMRAAMEGAGFTSEELAQALEDAEGATEDFAGALAAAGLNFTDAQGRLLPLAEIIEQLEPHADNAGLFMQLFGQRAGPAMAALVSQGSGALRELDHELQNSAGTAAHVAGVQMQGFNGAMVKLKSAFEGLQISIGKSGLLEFATDLTERFAVFVLQLSDLSPETLLWGSAIAMLAAALGPVLVGLGFMVSMIAKLMPLVSGIVSGFVWLAHAVKVIAVAFTGVTAPVAAAIAVIGGAAYLIWKNWEDFAPKFAVMWDGIKSLFSGFVEFVSGVFTLDLTRASDGLKTMWDGYVTYLSGLWETIKGLFSAAFDEIDNLLGGMLSDTKADLDAFADNVDAAFAALVADALAWGRDFVRSIIVGLAGLYDAGVEAIGNLASGLRESVTGLIEDARGWGRDIANGIAGGLRGARDRVTGAMSDVSGWVRDQFTSDNEIRSPSRLYQRFGEDIVTGLAIGIESEVDRPVDALNDTAKKMKGAFDGMRDAAQRAFEGFVTGASSAREAIGGLLQDLAKMLANRAFTSLFGGLFASFNVVGNDALSGALRGAMRSFEGGGYTGHGTRSGGVDGKGGFPALLHPDETVIDHTKGGGLDQQITLRLVFDESTGSFGAFVEGRAQGVAVRVVDANNERLRRTQQLSRGRGD